MVIKYSGARVGEEEYLFSFYFLICANTGRAYLN